MSGELLPFPLRTRKVSTADALVAAEQMLVTPIADRAARASELGLEDAETLLAACDVLRSRLETSPSSDRDDAEFLFHFLIESERQVGHFDEKEYFLGEFALIAGTACRILFRREEAHKWFARAEARFVLTENASSNIARLAYQKLALAAEERRFEEVLEAAPLWATTFRKLGLAESAVKCLFIQGNVYREMGQVPLAIEVFQRICVEAEEIGNERLLALASGTLAQFHRVVGDLPEALACAQRALPYLQETSNRVNLAKLRWCVGDIFREQGNRADALESYRSALRESEEIGIRGEVVALHLVIADLLLDAGMDRQAEWEVRAALPIIDEEQMVPEGMAALGLLRESLRRRQLDRGALRELHGYFPKG
jgi:tetratricopeptide (TPR) repeat protein